MMRKLVSQGHSAGTITLPVSWLRKYNLKKGDELALTERGDELVISSRKQKKVREVVLNLTRRDAILDNVLAGLYKKGVDAIKLKFRNENSFKKINQIIKNHLPEFEIMSFSKDECEIKAMSIANKEEVNNAVKRTFAVLHNQVEFLYNCIEADNLKALIELDAGEESLNRISAFYRRIINKQHAQSCDKNVFLYMTIRTFESAGDEIKFMKNYIIESSMKKINKQILPHMKSVLDFVNMFNKFYLLPNLDNFQEAYLKRKSVINTIHRDIKKLPKKDCILLGYLVMLVQRVYEAYNYVLSMTL